MMQSNNVMKINENLLWSSVVILCIFSELLNRNYMFVLIFWVLIILIIGNAKRFYSLKFPKASTIIRRSLYFLPFAFPLLLGFRIPILSKNLIYWCLLGGVAGLLLIFPKISEWKLFLSTEMIELTSKKAPINYFTQILMLIATAICEEIFFRGFIIGYLEGTNYLISILLSAYLFFLNHFGVKWRDSFSSFDFVIQTIFGLISACLFIMSKSILPCIIGHIMYNTPLIILSVRGYLYHYKLFNHNV